MTLNFGDGQTDEERTGLQNDLDRLGDWSVRNKMPFNVSKCKVMHIGKKNTQYKYKMLDQEILETTEEKDLGVFFMDTYKSSTNNVSKKANKTIGLIRRYITNKGAEAMLILYKNLIRPVLDYCVPVQRPNRKKIC